jgi:hypothetical protein
MSQIERWLVGAVLLILMVGVLFGLGYSMSYLAGVSDLGPEMSLPLLAIGGIIALLAAIALAAGAFSLFDLSDRTQALGLPKGSVRAVIALSLVVLFAILTVYLYSDMSQVHLQSATGLTGDQKTEFRASLRGDQFISAVSNGMSGPDARWTVYYRATNPASEDFGKQLLVMIGTLVTSVASFYFGAKTAGMPQSAAAVVASSPPVIKSIPPTTQARNTEFLLIITGDNLDLIKEAKLTFGSRQVIATDLTSNASTVKCKVLVPAAEQPGVWDVSVNDGAGRQARLPGAMTVS